jgi:hypothetical protein
VGLPPPPQSLAAARLGKAQVHEPRCFLDDHKYCPPPLCTSIYPLRPFQLSVGRSRFPRSAEFMRRSIPSRVPRPSFEPFGLAAAEDREDFLRGDWALAAVVMLLPRLA